MEDKTVDKYGKSLRRKQDKIYSMCHDYLIDNFHKFSDANKIKISLALASKMVPTTQKHEGEITFNKTPDVILGDTKLEYDIGSRITQYTEET